LVFYFVNRNQNRGLSIDELTQAGNDGLKRAVKNFDWQKGTRFSTYARKCIWSHIERAIRKQSSNIHIPEYMVTMIKKKNRASEELLQRLERNPTDEELIAVLGWKKEELLKVIESENVLYTGSLDTPNENKEGTGTLKDFLEAPTSSDPTGKVMFDSQRKSLLSLFSTFPKRERQVAELRYRLTGDVPLTLTEIGKQLRISTEQVRQLDRRVLWRLKKPKMRQKLAEILVTRKAGSN
jgi:RNA polymerase primary sigma factor